MTNEYLGINIVCVAVCTNIMHRVSVFMALILQRVRRLPNFTHYLQIFSR